ncbi:MAG: calcium/sodium antiporter, partial [Planctomycetota bacterium]
AAALNIPDLVIGLTVIAIGTSLPELALSIQAARRGHAEIAVGNVLGSNTFNLLCVLGIASLVNPLPIPESAIRDLAVCAGFTVAMLVMLTTRRGLSRTEGLVLVASYVIYMGVVGLDVVPPQGGG